MADRLRVVHFAFSDVMPGACSATYRLHRTLLAQGVDSLLVVGRKGSDDPTVIGPGVGLPQRRADLANRLEWKAQQWAYGEGIEKSPSLFGSGQLRTVLKLNPDVVNLHWIQGALVRPPSLRQLAGVPVVWSLPDMWALLGAQHYSGGDAWYEDAPSRGRGVEGALWRRKRRALRSLPSLTVTCPSRWMVDAARNSTMLGDREVRLIPYGVDVQSFHVGSRAQARAALGLPSEGRVILFGAVRATQNPRKGWAVLRPALQKLAQVLADDPPTVAVFGSDAEGLDLNGLPSRSLGVIDDERTMALAYQAADVFVAPSVEEAFGLTVLEALACGTPVAAFDIGGIPDMVEHRGNGYLARPLDADDLADGIAWLLSRPAPVARALRERARQTAVGRFNIRDRARDHADLYDQVRRAG